MTEVAVPVRLDRVLNRYGAADVQGGFRQQLGQPAGDAGPSRAAPRHDLRKITEASAS